MKWIKRRSKQRSTSSKPFKKENQQAQAKVEEAGEARGRGGRKENDDCYSTNSCGNLLQTLDLNTNHQRVRCRTSRPNTKSLNRSSLKDDSAAGKARRERRRRSSISFCEQLEVKDIIPAKDLVQNSKQLWWQDTEYQKMVELSLAVVELARVDKNTETRGLEDLMRNDHRATFKTRQDVLLAQRILKERQIKDDEAIGGLYQTSTAKYLQEAAQRASQDEREVRRYLADTRRMCRRMSV